MNPASFHTGIQILLVALVCFGCNNNTKTKLSDKTANNAQKENVSNNRLTEADKRKYFADKIAFAYGSGFHEKDSTLDFSYFMRTNYPSILWKNIGRGLVNHNLFDNYLDPFIYAFEEDYIDITKIDSTRNWFRIIVNPCFRIPYCIILEKKNHKTYLTSKTTNGAGGYNCGLLDCSLTQIFSDSLYDDISYKLNSLNFWQIKMDSLCTGGFDGERWSVEAIHNGRYNNIDRWSPEHCGDTITKQIAQIGVKLRELGKIDEREGRLVIHSKTASNK